MLKFKENCYYLRSFPGVLRFFKIPGDFQDILEFQEAA
jgi:hypothetical protein